MKVELNAIKKYKINKWYDARRRCIMFGIDVVMTDGKSYHVCDNDGEIMFDTYGEALYTVKRYNKEHKLSLSHLKTLPV